MGRLGRCEEYWQSAAAGRILGPIRIPPLWPKKLGRRYGPAPSAWSIMRCVLDRKMERRVVAIVLAASLLFRLAVVARDVRDLAAQGPLLDDCFYAFGIARNIAQGQGSTFDGVHATNGYQPLYVFLLVPLYVVCGGNDDAPIRIALVFSAVLNVLTGWVLYRLLRRRASFAASLLGLILWGFGPVVVRHALNGLETALAMFLVAAVLEYYLTVYRPLPRPGPRHAMTLGMLLGLAILARIDAALLAVAVAVDQIRGGSLGRTRLVHAGAVCAVVLIPWCVANEALLGRLLPDSGLATRFLSQAYAARDVPTLARATEPRHEHRELLLFNVSESLLLLGTSPPVLIFTRSLERVLQEMHVDPPARRLALSVFVAGLIAAALLASHSRRWSGTPVLSGEHVVMYLHALLLVAVYCFVVYGHIFFSRYYYPIFFLSVFVGASTFETILRGLERVSTTARRAAALAVIGLYAILMPFMAQNRLRGAHYGFVNVTDWIVAHTAPGARIGVFNCGAIGYFSDRHVFNLDGKVNPAALAALRGRNLDDYLRSEGIEYVIDHRWILRRFELVQGSDLGAGRWSRMAEGLELGVAGWEAYRVRPAAMLHQPAGTGVGAETVAERGSSALQSTDVSSRR